MNNQSTAITQYLDKQGIEYKILTQSKQTTSIKETAQQRGICPSRMVKSILLKDMDNNYLLACVPGDKVVDPKKVRAKLSCRRVTCVAAAQVYQITGFEVGTVTPLLLPDNITILFDVTLSLQNKITISSGSKLFGIELYYLSLQSLCSPILTDICRD
ncbi:aminoacyl-tRNA deacylase [Vibrio marisflavi]|uniref:YbaK/aminoacyl-tRNA synthetase-associated domain-containing protein n=1 Tax=Vibrio marisflavi CECT 7928 TaxID=634439 RepID=A0ABM9A7G3_9VIBR|nr:YbaK/EbsC family protein [Vibrio marisflavi]CAH0541421.1 hypothetical protein VMF7928_03550 [Vibrio marisflavi CECT 7928]